MKLLLLTAAAVLASTQAAYYGSPTDYSMTEVSDFKPPHTTIDHILCTLTHHSFFLSTLVISLTCTVDSTPPHPSTSIRPLKISTLLPSTPKTLSIPMMKIPKTPLI